MIRYTRGDLHLHTQFSDGKTSVAELLRFTESAEGYKVLSITDHHFFTLPEIVETPACLWIPGIEISTQVF